MSARRFEIDKKPVRKRKDRKFQNQTRLHIHVFDFYSQIKFTYMYIKVYFTVPINGYIFQRILETCNELQTGNGNRAYSTLSPRQIGLSKLA